RSVHNVGYWSGRDYLGVGTGAYGTVSLRSAAPSDGTSQTDDTRIRYRNLLSPERYMSSWSERAARWESDVFRTNLTEFESISADEAIQEALLLGLRIAEGVDVEAVASL